MLIYKAPGDFPTILKTTDRGPKRVPKSDLLDPPKKHSKIDVEIQEALKRLYISRSSTLEPSRKSCPKIRGVEKTEKSTFPNKMLQKFFRALQAHFAQTLRFSVFRQFSGRAGDPIGPRIGPVGPARGPDRTPPKQNIQMSQFAP